MEYTCERCGTNFTQLYNLKRHLNKKQTCSDNLQCNKSVKDIIEALNLHRDDFKYTCKHCQKKFACRQNLHQHKSCCHMRPQTINNNTNIYNNNTTNNINNNINNNVTIQLVLNNFGSEDLSHILKDHSFLDQCIKSITTAIPTIVAKIHYDPNKPENNNVQLKSSKRKAVMVYQDGAWVEKHMNEVVPSMAKKSGKILYNHLVQQEVDSSDDEARDSLLNKQQYIGDVMTRTKPAYDDATCAIKACINNHRHNEVDDEL